MADTEFSSVPMPDISSDAARDAWLNGTPQPSADQPADAAPAKAVDSAPSTDVDAKPASEPGDPAKPKSKGVKARTEELDADIAALNERLRIRKEIQRELDATDRARPKQDAKPDSSPAVDKKAEAARFRAMPDAPKLEEFDSYDDWAIEMASFVADKKLEAREARSQQESRARHDEQRFTQKAHKASERFNSYLEKNPAAKERISPELLAIVPISQLKPGERIGAENFIAEQIFESDFTGELADHFSTDAGFQDFQRLMRLSPDGILKAIGKLEAKFDGGTAPSSTKSPKTISTAPDPAETFGRRPAAPADALEAALLSGDPTAYQDEANRRDWARKNP
jgi:hypothetical protein